jgi:hypothetical protein
MPATRTHPRSSIPIDDIEKGIREEAAGFEEITSDKPNVWWELGYAFPSPKPLVMVCERNAREKVPFDIRRRILYYNRSPLDLNRPT